MNQWRKEDGNFAMSGDSPSSSARVPHRSERPFRRETAYCALFPSSYEIEAIEIPSCQDVFDKLDEHKRRRRKSPPMSVFSEDSSTPCRRYTESSPCLHGLHPRSNPQPEIPLDFPQQQCYDDQPISSRRMIEISPGFELPLIGSQETLQALRRGRMACTACIVCESSNRLYCIDDARYVLCPTCLVISPMGLETLGQQGLKMSTPSPSVLTSVGGVGLGMTELDFLKYHYEQAQQRND
jgi:hypothetical protein